MEEDNKPESSSPPIHDNEFSNKFLQHLQSGLVKRMRKKRRSSLDMTRESIRAKRTMDRVREESQLDQDLKIMDEMSVNQQISLYREQMRDIAFMKRSIEKLKADEESLKEEKMRSEISESSKRELTQKVALSYYTFRVMQLKFSLDDQIQLSALFHQVVRGDCTRDMIAWPLPSYLEKRRLRSAYVKAAIELVTTSSNTSKIMLETMNSLGNKESCETFLTTHRSLSRDKIRDRWKSFGGMKFDRIASRLVSKYEDMHPEFKSFLSENSRDEEAWSASLSRLAMNADTFDAEKIQEEREIYFGNDMVGGVKDVFVVSAGVTGQLALKGRDVVKQGMKDLMHYDVSKTKIGKVFGKFYNSKRVVSFRYRLGKMRRQARATSKNEEDITKVTKKKTRWIFKMRWKLSSKFRGDVIRLQCMLRRLIAQHELNRLRAEKNRLDRLINRIIRRWRFWTFMARMRRIVKLKHEMSILINRQARIRLARNWRRRRWKEMHRSAVVIQCGIRRFIQRVPYVARDRKNITGVFCLFVYACV